MKQWYALYTKPNSEHRVAATLRQHNIDTYLPEVWSRKSRGSHRKVPFFPCYLFIRTDLNKISASKWQWTPGLRRIVAFHNKPAPIPDKTIDLIQRRLNEVNAKGGLKKSRFQKGDVVRVSGGPFSDMMAIFQGKTSSEERVQVLLNFMGRMSRIHLEMDDLEETPSGTPTPKPQCTRRTRGNGRRIKSR